MKMRTKQYLAALCLPLAFAACSDEEFVTDTPSLGNRGTVNVTINAEKPWFDGINTRMTIDGNKFMWEKDKDMIGAARVDHTTMSTVENKVDVNYAFTAQSNGAVSAFNGKSPIAKGNYLFYYSYADHLGYDKMDLSVPVQEYNVEAATAENGKNALQQAVGYMKMISPIVDLSDNGVGYKDAQNYDLNLSFVNLYTVVKVNISAANIKEGTTPKIQKVALNASGSGFVKEAFANMENIAGGSNANVVAPDADTKQIGDADMAEAIAAIEELVDGASNSTVATIYEQSGVTTANGAAELNIKGDLALSEAENTVLYILAPKGKYNDGLTLEVTTSEGTYTRTISKPATGDLVLGNAIQPIAAELDFNANVALPKKFSIATATDWNNAIDFINNHAQSYIAAEDIEFALTADVTVASLPDFKAKVTGAHTLTLSGNNTIKENKVTSSTATLAVAAGATLTLNIVNCDFAAIQNNGTLNVNASQDKKITNYGTMNVVGDATLSKGLDNGKADGPRTSEAVEGAINVAEGKTLIIADVAMKNFAGTITVDGTLTNNVASDNTAKIIIGKEGKLNGSTAITNAKGIIENSGTLAVEVTNDKGTVIAKDGGKGDNTSAINKGIVIVENVTTFATLQQGVSNKYVFGSAGNAPSVATEVANSTEYDAANSATAITNIILTTQRSWTINGSNTPANATTLTLKGVELVLESGLTGKSIVVDGGTSSIIAKDESEKAIATANLTVNEGATLNVGNYITFNATSGNNQNATILGNLNVAAGAKLYFKTASVGSDDVSGARLTVEGNVAAVEAGDFGVVADGFENWGAIVSKTGDSVAGKISASENKSDSATASGKGIGKASTVTAA